MSSPPSDPGERPPQRSAWRPWRKTMMAGALVLLAAALAEALLEPDPPQVLKVAAFVAGYLLLAIGFGLRMRSR